MTYEERSNQIAKKMMMLHGHGFKDPVGQKQDIIDSCMEMAQFVEEQMIEKMYKILEPMFYTKQDFENTIKQLKEE